MYTFYSITGKYYNLRISKHLNEADINSYSTRYNHSALPILIYIIFPSLYDQVIRIPNEILMNKKNLILLKILIETKFIEIEYK